MADLPSGNVTFLFTDIEGSTRLWESNPAEMAIALARHEMLVREAASAHSGHVFKTVGDAFCIAFADASDALAAALRAQRSLVWEHWPTPKPILVRMAAHTGACESRNGDYLGPPVNRVARLLAIAHGKQILVSGATAARAADRLPADTSLLDRGSHRLKDLQDAEKVFQLAHPDLPSDFPSLRSLSTHPNNLPQQLSTFVGRARELVELKSLLDNTRLLTVTGAGGCGKTRLTVQLAANLLESFEDGVWFVELAAIADAALVPQAVAGAFQLREEAGADLTSQITEHLRSKRVMLVLDNCEHLVYGCARLVDELLRHCSRLVVLVSSRERLGVAGEVTYRVPSLSMPEPGRDASPERLATCESVALFVERARSHLPMFAVTRDNAAPLASICRRLDGIALAIELAAARIATMPVATIAARLDHHFRILDRGPRASPARQRTLRGLIDWSYDLLDERERVLFARLSVFAGGWTLEAAEAVGVGDPLDTADVLDVLAALVDKSLVVHDSARSRYRMLETVAHYARDRLVERGEDAAFGCRLRDWCLDLLATERPHMHGDDQAARLARVAAEHDNLRAALASAFASADGKGALRLAVESQGFLTVRGFLREARQALEAALAHAPADAEDDLKARALRGAGIVAYRQSDFVASRDFHLRSLEIRQRQRNRAGEASALESLGLVALEVGESAEGVTLLERALALLRAEGHEQPIAQSLNNLGTVLFYQGEAVRAAQLLEESLAIKRRIGDPRGIAMTLDNLGDIALSRGEYAEAGRLYHESLAMRRELGDALGIQRCTLGLADLALRLGDAVGARPLLEETVGLARESGDRVGLVHAFESLADLAEMDGDARRAATLRGHAEWLRLDIGYVPPPAIRTARERLLAATRAAVGDDDAFERALAAGATMSTEEAIALAFARTAAAYAHPSLVVAERPTRGAAR